VRKSLRFQQKSLDKRRKERKRNEEKTKQKKKKSGKLSLAKQVSLPKVGQLN
jgi:hypothetical protein